MSAATRRFGALLVLWVGWLGCADEVSPVPSDQCAQAPLVDETLLAFLSKARSAHHQADLAGEDENGAQAIRALQSLVEGPVPTGADGPGPEVREVLADTHARLGDLRSAVGAFDAAERDIERGLELETGRTHLRGHLYEIRGLVLERKYKALKASGDDAAAEVVRKSAIEALERGIEIQDEVITKALGEPIPSPSAP